MEIPEYSNERKARESFVDSCISLENKSLTKDLIQSYSALLNKYYPKHSLHGSHSLNQWIAARNNIDTLFSLNGIDPPKHPSRTQQITIGVTIGVVTFIVTSILTFSGAILLNSGYLIKTVAPNTEASSQDSQTNTQMQMQSKAPSQPPIINQNSTQGVSSALNKQGQKESTNVAPLP